MRECIACVMGAGLISEVLMKVGTEVDVIIVLVRIAVGSEMVEATYGPRPSLAE